MIVDTTKVHAWSSIFIESISFVSLFPIQAMFPAAHHCQELSHCNVNLVRETRYHEKVIQAWKAEVSRSLWKLWDLFCYLSCFWYAYQKKPLTLTSLGPRLCMGIKVFSPQVFPWGFNKYTNNKCHVWRSAPVGWQASLLAVGSLHISDCNGISNAISCNIMCSSACYRQFEMVIPTEDSVITEMTTTLRDWGTMWKQLYVASTLNNIALI